MLRSAFFATGLFVVLCGVTFKMVDKVILNVDVQTARPTGMRAMMGMMRINSERQREINPPEWAAFSLMSVGSVTMISAPIVNPGNIGLRLHWLYGSAVHGSSPSSIRSPSVSGSQGNVVSGNGRATSIVLIRLSTSLSTPGSSRVTSAANGAAEPGRNPRRN